MASFDSMIKQKVDIIPNEDEGNDLRKQYNQHKLGWCYDDGNPVEALTSEEKKKLKLFLEDEVEFRFKIICNKLTKQVKKIRSKNSQRNSIDDLIDLMDMFSDKANPHSTLPLSLFIHVQQYAHGWDVNENFTKERYKKRKSWGGAK